MMVKKNFAVMSAILLVSAAITLPGCWKNSAPDAAKTVNTNQATISNNNNVPANDNLSANVPSAPPSAVNNAPTAPVNTAKKSSSPVKLPTPQIGSGASDMLLFTQVRGALSSDNELLNSVIIEIKEGNATLTGSVSSAAQKTKAAQLVQSVNGVKSVKNNLRVSS